MKPVRIAVCMTEPAFGRAVARGLAESGNGFLIEVAEPGPPKVRKKTSPMAAGRDRYRSAAYRFMESVYAGGILTELTDFRKSPVRIL